MLTYDNKIVIAIVKASAGSFQYAVDPRGELWTLGGSLAPRGERSPLPPTVVNTLNSLKERRVFTLRDHLHS
jgi:hypothetical protein